MRAHVLNFLSTLEEKVDHLQTDTSLATIAELEQTYIITDWYMLLHNYRITTLRPLFIASSVLLFLVVLLFFLHPILGIQLGLAWIAILGATIHTLLFIIISQKSSLHEILVHVEWGI